MLEFLRIGDGRMDLVTGEFVASPQTLQFNQKIEPDNRAAKLTDKMDGRFCRSSGRQQVVDDQHMLSDLDRVTMHCKAVLSILKTIFHFVTISRKFARLSDRDESSPETGRKNPAENKPTRLNSDNLGDPAILIPSRQLVGETPNCGRIFQERSDVIKENTGLRKVRHFSNECLIIDGRHGI